MKGHQWNVLLYQIQVYNQAITNRITIIMKLLQSNLYSEALSQLA
jgi:hypothetical protein